MTHMCLPSMTDVFFAIEYCRNPVFETPKFTTISLVAYCGATFKSINLEPPVNTE
nr:MAG TPA: hypothetical protein [Caudoviricetes sp.]